MPYFMRRTLLLAVSLIILTGLAVGMIYKIRRPKATADIARVEKDIRERLPIGTSRTDVEALLDQKGMPHSYTGESNNSPSTSTQKQLRFGAPQEAGWSEVIPRFCSSSITKTG